MYFSLIKNNRNRADGIAYPKKDLSNVFEETTLKKIDRKNRLADYRFFISEGQTSREKSHQ